MSDFLLALPTWLLGALILGPFALFSGTCTLLIGRYRAAWKQEGHNDVFGAMFGAVAVMYGVLLALVVFAVWDEYSSARDVTDRETADLVALYYDTESFPAPVQQDARKAIREYTASVISDEFPTMQNGDPSPVTRARLYGIFAIYLELQPQDALRTQLASDSFGRLNEVTLLRRERLSASSSSLPDIFWALLLPGGLITLAMGAWLYMEHRTLHLIGSLVVGLMLGTTVFLIAVLDRPFTGSIAIQPDAYRQNLQLYGAMDQVMPHVAQAGPEPGSRSQSR